jgi:hypothetical protein
MNSPSFFLRIVLSGIVTLAAAAGCSSADDGTGTGDDQDITSVKQCKGALPQNCQVCGDGTTQCAHWVVQNKKCAIETCPSSGTGSGTITSPSQCQGGLPQMCQVCSNGTSRCAHWAVKNGACAIEVCD